MRTHSRAILALAGALAIGTIVHAQRLLTIPESLANAGKSLSSGPSIPSGPSPTLDDVLRQTDVVVHGVIGPGHSYLSEDQHDVYTDYPIVNPVVLFEVPPRTLGKPGVPSPVVTVYGGVITINGLTYTRSHDAFPGLSSGDECLLLLNRDGGRYFVAGLYFGAFKISDGRLMRLTRKTTFAPDLEGSLEEQSRDRILRRLASMGRRDH